MPHIFTYGSLMFAPVWSRVVAGSYDSCEAVLPGYDRKGIRGEVYPAVVPSAGQSQVKGLVYLDVSIDDLARLDRFEGEYYFRKTEQVVMLDESLQSAEVYILKEEYYPVLSPGYWDPVHFSTTGIQIFIRNYLGRYLKH